MSGVSVLGAGAFGTALAIALAQGGTPVTLWARDGADKMRALRENARRLPGHVLPDAVEVTGDLARAARANTLLLSVPMQALRGFLSDNATLFRRKTLVACCKGIDLTTCQGPHELLSDHAPHATGALLSGPSFAADIAAGLPTALTLATAQDGIGEDVQAELSGPALRVYRSTDMAGVAIGGAMKNVVAIACGVTMGAGLGESARAALMTRGYAEMVRHATEAGARAETLAGLSGLGDLALTCTSEKSRNYRFGLALGRTGTRDTVETTEGIATARALAARTGPRDMPITGMVAALLDGQTTVARAMDTLLSRPLRAE